MHMKCTREEVEAAIAELREGLREDGLLMESPTLLELLLQDPPGAMLRHPFIETPETEHEA